MKISFTTFACPQWDFDQVVDAAVTHGYQGIEFRCDALQVHGVEVSSTASQRSHFRARLEDAGIEPCCLATSLQFVREHIVEEALPRLELAAEIGCPAIRVFCGSLAEEMTKAQAIERVGYQLRDVAITSDQLGVQLWLETHDTLSLGTDTAAAVRLGDHPAVGVLYDNLHPYRRGESLDVTLAALSGLIRYAHFHDAVNDPEKVIIRPVGHGGLPIDQMFVALVKSGFDGYISGEWFYDMYGPDPDESLKAYYRDITNLAQRYGIHVGRSAASL